ncbi:dTDP-4-dehydrorhamnose 3,5-epimerase [Bradyrhizobium sp. LB7.2]
MKFESLSLIGAYLIHDEPSYDERGSFGRVFCADEFEGLGLPRAFAQMGLSRTLKRGTLRGLHFQREPKAEGKLVRCIRGRVFDAIVDLRPGSETFKQPFTIELSQDARRALYVPPGFAHGFLTLTDHVEMLYSLTESHAPELAGGVRWNDSAFGITWPEPIVLISERDRSFKDFIEAPARF